MQDEEASLYENVQKININFSSQVMQAIEEFTTKRKKVLKEEIQDVSEKINKNLKDLEYYEKNINKNELEK